MRWISVEFEDCCYYFNADLLEYIISYRRFTAFKFNGDEYTFGTGLCLKNNELKKHGAVKLSESIYVWPERLTGFWLNEGKRPF